MQDTTVDRFNSDRQRLTAAAATTTTTNTNTTSDTSPQQQQQQQLWEPSGNWWKDFLYFSGPGLFVSVAYVDPGNYQADIQAGATSKYNLLFALWWTGLLSIYVQILCVRLSFYTKLTLAELQAIDTSFKTKWSRYLNWLLAESSAIITDLPGVIGIGIAVHYFLNWPYWVGVVLSLLTTMIFLGTINNTGSTRILEYIILVMMSILAIAIWTELSTIGITDTKELFKGWAFGFTNIGNGNNNDDEVNVFAIAGILGAVVMPHNLYLHTAAVLKRAKAIKADPHVLKFAIKSCTWEPVVPILITFFINMAVVAIAAESVYGTNFAKEVGLTDFCDYFINNNGIIGGSSSSCFLWGIALLAAGQSSAITTTYTGQYIMDGFLNIRLPLATRAIITRLGTYIGSVCLSQYRPLSLSLSLSLTHTHTKNTNTYSRNFSKCHCFYSVSR